MTRSEAEDDLREQFGRFYNEGTLPVHQRIEQAVCGCDYGGVSWATRDEIDLVSDILKLGPGDQLMDLGAGAGWPGLYLGAASGCDVTLTDLPHEGLVIAAARARADGLVGAAHAVVADGQSLPCKTGRFDALTHSDVLCCLPPKRAVLRECHRVIREDGQMVFSVIFIAPDLGARDHARVVVVGPPYVDADASYEDMLGETGWQIADRFDRTAEYLSSVRSFFRASLDNEAGLVEAGGKDEFDARMSRERELIDCLERRHLQRALYQVRPA